MRTTRIKESTKELDDAERIWWDRNAETIEKYGHKIWICKNRSAFLICQE
jgi:hypothetical protein